MQQTTKRVRRTPLFLLLLLIVGIPVLLWIWGVWLPSRAGCDYRVDGGRSTTYAAYSVHFKGTRGAPDSPHPMPDSFKGAMGAELRMASAQGRPWVVQAWNDLSFVSCALDSSDRHPLIWFAEFRDPALVQHVQQARVGLSDPVESGSVLVRAGDPDDPQGDARVHDTLAALQTLQILYRNLFPPWFPADLSKPERVVAWVGTGVLLRGDQPEQLFLIDTGDGITGGLDAACRQSAHPSPMCNRSSADHRVGLVRALARDGRGEDARRRLLKYLDEAEHQTVASEIAIRALRAFDHTPRARAECAALVSGLEALKGRPEVVRQASMIDRPGTRVVATEPPDEAELAFLSELRAHVAREVCVSTLR